MGAWAGWCRRCQAAGACSLPPRSCPSLYAAPPCLPMPHHAPSPRHLLPRPLQPMARRRWCMRWAAWRTPCAPLTPLKTAARVRFLHHQPAWRACACCLVGLAAAAVMQPGGGQGRAGLTEDAPAAAHPSLLPPAGWTFEGGTAEAFRQALQYALLTYREHPESFRRAAGRLWCSAAAAFALLRLLLAQQRPARASTHPLAPVPLRPAPICPAPPLPRHCPPPYAAGTFSCGAWPKTCPGARQRRSTRQYCWLPSTSGDASRLPAHTHQRAGARRQPPTAPLSPPRAQPPCGPDRSTPALPSCPPLTDFSCIPPTRSPVL